jgi:hypothetical protein
MSISDQIEKYINAIEQRNLREISEIFFKSSELTIVFPNGSEVIGYDNIVEMHRSWFSEKNWIWNGRHIRTMTFEDTAITVIKYEYISEPTGQTIGENEFLLSLTWKCVGGDWFVIFDQNTPLRG